MFCNGFETHFGDRSKMETGEEFMNEILMSLSYSIPRKSKAAFRLPARLWLPVGWFQVFRICGMALGEL